MPQFAHKPDIFHPTEAFLNPLALDRADVVSLMVGGSTINCAVCHMGRHMTLAAFGYKTLCVVAFVSAHRPPARTPFGIQQRQR